MSTENELPIEVKPMSSNELFEEANGLRESAAIQRLVAAASLSSFVGTTLTTFNMPENLGPGINSLAIGVNVFLGMLGLYTASVSHANSQRAGVYEAEALSREATGE